MARVSRYLSRFRRDERGNAIVVFTCAAPVLIAFTMAAVDYGSMSGQKARVQAAADAAALALAPLAGSTPIADLTTQASQIIKNYSPEKNFTVASLDVVNSGSELIVGVHADYKLKYLRAPGMQDTFPISATSRSAVSKTTYEIALVFDNSGSMSDMVAGRSKIDAAKDAANGLVNTIMGSPAMASRTKISVVPYTAAVNVGSEYRNSWWVDNNGLSSIHWQNINQVPGVPSRFTLFDWLGEPWGGCFETRPNGLGLTDDPPVAGNSNTLDTLFVPMFAPDEPGGAGKTTQSGQPTWGGYEVRNSYVDDAGGSCSGPAPTDWAGIQRRNCKYHLGTFSTPPDYQSVFKMRTGPNFNCNAKKMLRLSTNRTTISAKINEMQGAGDTSIFEGLAWAWRSLSPNAPFGDGRAYTGNPDNRKVMILLTDGDNNWRATNNPSKSLYAAMGFYGNNRIATGITDQTTANTTLNTVTKQVCANAKARGIIIYTVGIVLPGQTPPPSYSDLIMNCASTINGKGQYSIATDGNQLIQIFQGIANSIMELRIAR